MCVCRLPLPTVGRWGRRKFAHTFSFFFVFFTALTAATLGIDSFSVVVVAVVVVVVVVVRDAPASCRGLPSFT